MSELNKAPDNIPPHLKHLVDKVFGDPEQVNIFDKNGNELARNINELQFDFWRACVADGYIEPFSFTKLENGIETKGSVDNDGRVHGIYPFTVSEEILMNLL